MRLSLRVRMALLLGGLLALVEIPVVILVLVLHGHGAINAFDAVLLDQARGAATTIAADREGMLTSGLRLAGLALDAEASGTLSAVRLAIVTDQRLTVRSTDRPAAEEAERRAAADGQPFGWTAADGQRRRGVGVPLPGTTWIVWLSSDLQRHLDLTRPVRAAVVSSALLAVLVAGAGGWLLAGVAVRPLEDLTSLARNLTPASIGQGVPLGDTSSEVARLRLELDRALRRLDRAFRAQERFASNVAHELKTPIATVLTEAQVLRLGRGRRGDAEEGFLASVEEEMRRLGRLVEGFLLLTRTRDGDQTIDERRTDPNELIMSVVERVADSAAHAGVAVRAVLFEEEVPPLAGDPDLLATMLENLVRNAIRFSPQNGTIAVTGQRDDATFVLTVDDEGPGIAPELVARIFDRFVQSPEEQRRGRGHGLGLAIAQGVAELHGGYIEVAAEPPSPKGGCRMIVRLPWRHADAVGDDLS